MKEQQTLRPRIPVQAAPVARQGEVKNEKGVVPLVKSAEPWFPFAADDAE